MSTAFVAVSIATMGGRPNCVSSRARFVAGSLLPSCCLVAPVAPVEVLDVVELVELIQWARVFFNMVTYSFIGVNVLVACTFVPRLKALICCIRCTSPHKGGATELL